MKSTVILIALFTFSIILHAQDTTVSSKIDTVLLKQKETLELQKKIYEEVRYIPPLENKWAGIEINIARAIATIGRDFFTLTGTFSLFDVFRKGELAFPFFYQNGKRKETSFGANYEIPLTLINLDATYRHFIGKYQDGFYFSGGTRYTYIKGMEGQEILFLGIGQQGKITTTSRLGVYFGIGYRYFTHSGFYWGVSLIYGRYFGKCNDYREVTFDDRDDIIDMELLKFGIAF